MEGVSGMCLSAVLKAWLKTLNTWGHKLVQGLLILFYFFPLTYSHSSRGCEIHQIKGYFSTVTQSLLDHFGRS